MFSFIIDNIKEKEVLEAIIGNLDVV